MDKQELLNIIGSLVVKYSNEGDYPNVVMFNAYSNSLGWIEKLDELKKPVIPQFVAEFVDWTTKRNWAPSDAIKEFQDGSPDTANLPDTLKLDKLSEYFEKAYCRYDFERACIIGYEIKEPLYYVRFPFNVWDEDASELVTFYNYLAWDNTSDETRIVGSPNGGGCDFRTKLTKTEIESIDERCWAFAIPVEEVE